MSSQEARAVKSSSEILNELFGTFDTNFDEAETESTSKRKHKKEKRSRKEKDFESKKKKKSKRERSKSVEKSSKVKKSHRKSKSVTPPPSPCVANDRLSAEPIAADNTPQAASKYPSIQFRGKTIVLDVEEGEITEAAERKAEKKKHLRKRAAEEAERLKKQNSSRHEPISSDEDRPTRRQSESNSRRSRSKSPRRPRDKSSYQACSWERAGTRERSPADRPIRRSSAYDYDWQRYNGSRGGFGYDGKSTRSEDDYYDYRQQRRGRSRSRSRSSERRSSRSYRRSRSRSRSPYRRGSSARADYRRSSARERSTLRRLHPDDIIDKSVLLDIARKNAAKLMRSGCLPTDIFSRDQILAIKAGGKSVEELTEYCRRVAKRDAAGDANDSSDDEKPINHPFTVKDRPMPGITMNIRNSIPLQIRTPHELAIENAKLKIIFPVSSGTQHRYKELEWKPVDKDEEKKEKEKKKNKEDLSKALLPVGTVIPQVHEEEAESTGMAITHEPKPSTAIDIGSVISKRLRAVKDLEENPDNSEAKERFESASNEMKQWAEAKALEPKFLTPAELLLGPQAWVKKDQLKTATALQGGMGMHLLQRMGWNPGEGLGKNKEGSTEPLALDIKMDKKGLASTAEGKGPSLPSVFDLTGKHPVSSLMELCAKRRWGDPTFELCFEHGPSHKPQFVYKVTVNGVEYQPCVANRAKKQAKHDAAAFCLQSLGLLPIPKTAQAQKPAELLKTVSIPAAAAVPPLPPANDNKLMPPPPPPPALQKLLEFPLPPRLPSNIESTVPSPTAAAVASGANKVPLLSLDLSQPPTFNRFSQQKVKDPDAGRLGSRLMSLAGMPSAGVQIPQSADPYNQAIVQVPLPNSSLQGFPGLTTF